MVICMYIFISNFLIKIIIIHFIYSLKHEIQTLNDQEFKKHCNWLIMLTQLIEENQDCDRDAECREILAQWTQERDMLRYFKMIFDIILSHTL